MIFFDANWKSANGKKMYNRFLKTFLSYICTNCTYKDKQVSPRFPDCDILLSRAFLRLKVFFSHDTTIAAELVRLWSA